jgi:hypothetical protein
LTTMQTFIDARQIDEILNGFEPEWWLEKSSHGDFTSMGLTDPGMAEREVIFKQQSEVRRRALHGITDQEYATVIDVLRGMVNYLEGDSPSPPKICIAPELLSIIAQQSEHDDMAFSRRLAFTPKCGYEVTHYPFVATICSHIRGK